MGSVSDWTLSGRLRPELGALDRAAVRALHATCVDHATLYAGHSEAPHAEADCALVTAVFGDGVRVVRSGPAGSWAPPGAWARTPASGVDVYTTEASTVSCPFCSALDWHRAGDGWTCALR